MGDVDHIQADPGLLRALTHPLRGALLYELHARGRANATALAEAVDAPVNSVSFHLRQLARFGLIEEAEGGGDGRQRWWRPASRGGIEVDDAVVEAQPDGTAALEVFHRNAAAVWARMADRFFAVHADDAVRRSNDVPLLLTAQEAERLADEVAELVVRWLTRSQSHADDPAAQAQRRTYLLLTMLQPRD